MFRFVLMVLVFFVFIGTVNAQRSLVSSEENDMSFEQGDRVIYERYEEEKPGGIGRQVVSDGGVGRKVISDGGIGISVRDNHPDSMGRPGGVGRSLDGGNGVGRSVRDDPSGVGRDGGIGRDVPSVMQ